MQGSAVDRGEIDDDRKAEARAGPRFVEPLAAFKRVRSNARVQARAVVIDLRNQVSAGVLRPTGDARGANRHGFARPLAGVVEQIADEVGQVLRLPAEPQAVLQFDSKAQTAFGVQFLERAHQTLDDRLDVGHDADGPRPRGGARAVEVEGHLLAHDFGLLAHLAWQGRTRRIGLVDEHAERGLQRVSEIADLRARALDNLTIGVDELVYFRRERGDI